MRKGPARECVQPEEDLRFEDKHGNLKCVTDVFECGGPYKVRVVDEKTGAETEYGRHFLNKCWTSRFHRGEWKIEAEKPEVLTDGGTDASEDQAIEHTEAEDAGHIEDALPTDVEARLTKRAFSPGSLRKLLRDCYYAGPIGIGSGGWIGVFGNGKPGTEMRRPGGALYNYPRSWRYAALERGLKTALITHVGGGKFAATERGVAVLHRIDTCPEHEEPRTPAIHSSYYMGDPNTKGHIESHRLVTVCEACKSTGYSGEGGITLSSSSTSGYREYERSEKAVEYAVEWIEDHPNARTYGGEREVRPEAADEEPDVDVEAIEAVLTEHVENYTEPRPRERHEAVDTDLYDRSVLAIESEGDLFEWYGTDESLVARRGDTEGEVHVTVEDAEERRLRLHMSYEVAVEEGAKDAIKHDATDAKWSGEYWTISADGLPTVAAVLTGEYVPRQGSDPIRLTVTATEEAVSMVHVPMVGVEEDGTLATEDAA